MLGGLTSKPERAQCARALEEQLADSASLYGCILAFSRHFKSRVFPEMRQLRKFLESTELTRFNVASYDRSELKDINVFTPTQSTHAARVLAEGSDSLDGTALKFVNTNFERKGVW